MSFSDWTKKKKQQTGSTSSASGKTGTRVTAPQSSSILRDDTPSDFGEWTRKKSGNAMWRSEEIGFDQWMENLNNFSKRLSDDYSSRENTFQPADSFLSYQEDTNRSIDSYTRKSQEYRDYFTKYRDMYDADYGEGTVDRILSALDEGDSFLAGVRESLGNEYDFWSQFEDEDDYGTYLKGKEYAALAENDDFAEKSKYVSTYQPGTEKFNAWTGTYSNTGFADINYDYINKDETAVGSDSKTSPTRRYPFPHLHGLALRQPTAFPRAAVRRSTAGYRRQHTSPKQNTPHMSAATPQSRAAHDVCINS